VDLGSAGRKRIYGSQNAPRGSIFQLSTTFPMTRNVSLLLGLDAAGPCGRKHSQFNPAHIEHCMSIYLLCV